MNQYLNQIKTIVRKEGGFREKDIMENGYTLQKGCCWNNERKCIKVLKDTSDSDGYTQGFEVDLITKSIVG